MKDDLSEQKFLEYFESRTGIRPRVNHKGEAMLRCPCHDDKNSSLAVNAKKQVWHCFACNKGGGITQFEMFLRKCDRATARRELRAWFRGAPSRTESSPREIVAIYNYTDEDDVLLKQVLRYVPKHFSQRKSDGKGGWNWNVLGVREVPYRLSELIQSTAVFVTEGEKDADGLRALGLAATTNSGGAGKWPKEFASFFAAKTVVVVPDNDDIGRGHAEQVARNLHAVAASVKVVHLEGLMPKEDVSDWLNKGHTKEELLNKWEGLEV
jgi:putative DNA primase/helicase